MRTRIECYLLIMIVSLSSGQVLGQTPLEKGKTSYNATRYDEAEKELESIRPNSADYGSAQFLLGSIAHHKKEYEDAVDFFENATEANPNNSECLNRLGDAYAAVGGQAGIFTQMSVGPKALRAWEKAAQLDSKNINARVSLVTAYLMAPGFMGGGEDKAKTVAAEVLPLLEESLRATPENYLHLYWSGKVSATTGLKLDFGAASLQKYLAHTPIPGEPSLSGAHMRLGQIKEKQGNIPEAKKHFEMAVKLDSSMKQAQEGLERTSK